MKYCFVFVCQAGQLEWKASLLAASLKQQLVCDYELVALLPTYKGIQQPSTSTLQFLRSIGVRTETLDQAVIADYPISNKIACFAISTSADKLIFLDSDMLCTRAFCHQNRFEQFAFHAKLTDLADLTPSEWKTLYALLDQPFPEKLFKSTVSKEAIPLCFNSGFIAINASLDLYSPWVHWAKRMDSFENLPGRRPFLDQLSLPFTLETLKEDFDLLDERFNFPGEIRPIDVLDPPFFCHYHHLSHLLAESFLMTLIKELLSEFPALRNLNMPEPLLKSV